MLDAFMIEELRRQRKADQRHRVAYVPAEQPRLELPLEEDAHQLPIPHPMSSQDEPTQPYASPNVVIIDLGG